MVVGQGGMILHTSDGGSTWLSQSSGTTNTLFSVALTGPNTGTVVGAAGIVLYTMTGGVVGVKESPNSSGVIPVQCTLEQNYPNPFNPSTKFRYALPHTSFVTLTVYNTLGQQIAQLVNEQQQAGYHDAVFRGDGYASGVYFYRLNAGSFVQLKKMLLLK
jgi:hypothetical protein